MLVIVVVHNVSSGLGWTTSQNSLPWMFWLRVSIQFLSNFRGQMWSNNYLVAHTCCCSSAAHQLKVGLQLPNLSLDHPSSFSNLWTRYGWKRTQAFRVIPSKSQVIKTTRVSICACDFYLFLCLPLYSHLPFFTVCSWTSSSYIRNKGNGLGKPCLTSSHDSVKSNPI